MPDDLRTGLVEAMAREWMEFEGDDWDTMGPRPQAALKAAVAVMLDAALGFLTDNAEAWIRAGHEAGDLDDGMHRGDHALVDPLIAALSDSRDTGEKP